MVSPGLEESKGALVQVLEKAYWVHPVYGLTWKVLALQRVAAREYPNSRRIVYIQPGEELYEVDYTLRPLPGIPQLEVDSLWLDRPIPQDRELVVKLPGKDLKVFVGEAK